MKTHPTKRMWRTLVRVQHMWPDGVGLIIPGFDVHLLVFCPRKAIPPVIYDDMETTKRYHVHCNIGAETGDDLCFDGWENK